MQAQASLSKAQSEMIYFVLKKLLYNIKIKMNWKSLDFLEFGENYKIDLSTNTIYNKNNKPLSPYKNKGGYLRVKLSKKGKRKIYLLHRIIYQAHFGKIPENLVIDHIDRNPLNNDITNLRLVTQYINNMNKTKMGKGKNFDYKTDIGEFEQIHEDIYYSKTYRKFYRKIVEEDRSMTIQKDKRKNCYFLQWSKNNILHKLNVTDYVLNNLVEI